jgi:hypothetical protein
MASPTDLAYNEGYWKGLGVRRWTVVAAREVVVTGAFFWAGYQMGKANANPKDTREWGVNCGYID